MTSYSDITKTEYESNDCVFIRNFKQATYYIANNATLVDIFTDGNTMLVFVFYRNEHNELIKKWVNNKGSKT